MQILLSSTRRFFEVLLTLFQKDLKVKYKNMYLGYLWSLSFPLAQAAVFAFVFKLILRSPVENYLLFLLCGLFLWQWMANSVSTAPNVFLGNANIIKKVPFPRSALVASAIGIELMHFALTLPVVVTVLAFHGKYPAWTWIFGMPFQLMSQALFVYGISLFVATSNLFFRDMERLTHVTLMLVFYATPIVYPLDMVPADYRWVFYLNPAAVMIETWRTLIINGVIDFGGMGIGFLYGLAATLLGTMLYRSMRWRFAEVM